MPVTRGFYRCDTHYHVNTLLEMLADHSVYGFVLVSGTEVLLYEVTSVETKLVKRIKVDVGKKHKKGGQSAPRFGRIADQRRDRVVDYAATLIWEQWFDGDMQTVTVKGLVVAGPAEMKGDLVEHELFQKYFLPVLIRITTLNKVDSDSIHELYEAVKCDLDNSAVTEEMKLVRDFEAIMCMKSELTVFGEKEVRFYLAHGMLRYVLASEAMEFGDIHGPTAGIVQVLKTVGGKTELTKYGGVVGVKWFDSRETPDDCHQSDSHQ